MKERNDLVSQQQELYVPAEITVIEISTTGIICTSLDDYGDGGDI